MTGGAPASLAVANPSNVLACWGLDPARQLINTDDVQATNNKHRAYGQYAGGMQTKQAIAQISVYSRHYNWAQYSVTVHEL